MDTVAVAGSGVAVNECRGTLSPPATLDAKLRLPLALYAIFCCGRAEGGAAACKRVRRGQG